MRTRLLKAVMLAALTLLGLRSGQLLADSFTYTTVRRQVRVAILVSSAENVPGKNGVLTPENPDPFVFYVMDSRTDLKPLGLDYVNPLAPPVITADIYQRWSNRNRTGQDPAFINGSALSRVFQVGATVTKNMGAYWEANLDNLTSDDLQQYDILFIHTHKPNVAFPADQMEKLRKFVEAGGTLWVDDCGGFTFNPSAPFLFDLQYHNGNQARSSIAIASPNHALLTYPYIISPREVDNFGDKAVNDYYVFQQLNPSDLAPGDPSVNPPGGLTLTPVVWNTRGLPPVNPVTPNAGWRPYVLAGQYGAGRVVICAEDSGCAINDYVGGSNDGYGGNSGAISGETMIGAHPVDLKFAYNLSVWSGAHSTPMVDVRRSNGTDERLGAVLTDKWSGQPSTPISGTIAKIGGTAIYRHCMFNVDSVDSTISGAQTSPRYVPGGLFLHCYNINPAEDLDGDGNPDDGLTDFLTGTSYDQVWQLDLTQFGTKTLTGASAPTVIEFYQQGFSNQSAPSGLVNFNQRELVIVTLSDGTVVAARAFPRANDPLHGFPFAPQTAVDWTLKLTNPQQQDYGIDPDATNSPVTIPAAAWSEGVLFVAQNTADGGRIAAIDPRTGGSVFHPFSRGIETGESLVPDIAGVPSIIGTPTVGYIADTATGAADKMVYVHTTKAEVNGSQNMAESIRAFWFSTKNEPMTRISPTVFQSRSTVPWFIVDPANPGDSNLALRQRVYFNYRDPATGISSSQELTYNSGSTPNSGEYTITNTIGQPIKITVGGPVLGQNPDVDGVTIYANYTLDWAPGSSYTGQKVNARTVLLAPDINGSGSLIGGSPCLSPDDIAYYCAETKSDTQGHGVLFAVNEQNLSKSVVKWTYTMHDGFTVKVNDQDVTVPPRLRQLDPILPGYGSAITGVQFFGTPAYHDGVVYAVAKGSASGLPVSVLCAFKANPEFVIRLNQSIPSGSKVRVKQVNLLNSQNVNGSTTAAWVELVENQNFTVDIESGIIRITSMAPLGAASNFVSASMPFVVQIGNNAEQLIAGTQVDVINGNSETRMIGPAGVDNLLWYAVFPAALPAPYPSPGYVCSSPTVQGDVVWLGTLGGYIASFDADPSSTEPQFQAKGTQVTMFAVNPGDVNHLRWWQYVGAPVLQSPVGSANVLASNCAYGIRTFEDAYTVIADNKRLVEVNAAGETVWTCDGTRSYSVQGGSLPQYLVDPNGNVVSSGGTGVPVMQKIPFAKPTVVRHIGPNDFMVVDTGNNRVAQIDRGGNIVWEVSRVFDDFKGLLRPGDPVNLNEPTDCSYWTDYQPNGVNVVINGRTILYPNPVITVHYLISDTGNYRVIEVIDVYNTNGQPVQPTVNGSPGGFYLLRQLNFVSSTYATQGKQYRYRSAQRVVFRNSDLPLGWQDESKGQNEAINLTIAAISNFKLVGNTSSDPTQNTAVNALGDKVESGGGSIVVLSEYGRPLAVVSNLRIPDSTVAGGYRAQPITNPTYFAKFDEMDSSGALVFKYLLCDANGCYQLRSNGNYMDVEWMLSADDYYWMTGKRLYANSITRLIAPASNATNAFTPALHQFLIANSFSGEDNPAVFGSTLPRADFHGEVFILNPRTFDITASGATVNAPNNMHGYVRDFDPAGGGTSLAARGDASITWRTPNQAITATGLFRYIGDRTRATATSLVEQPAFADRPF